MEKMDNLKLRQEKKIIEQPSNLTVVQLMKRLILADTSNPPGNETRACRVLATEAERWGFTYDIVEKEKGRGNFLLTWEGNDSAKAPLILLSHLDVVPADPGNWIHPPFDAVETDGFIYGRGSLDTKQLTAMQMAALCALRQRGFTPSRTIYLIATADEERGSAAGLEYLLEKKPEYFSSGVVINEGGGFALRAGGREHYLLEVGQKGRAKVTLHALKQRGSPYFPDHGGLIHCLEFLQAMNELHLPEPKEMLPMPAVFQGLPQLKPLINACQKNTWTTTGLSMSDDLPSDAVCSATIDLRLLPGVTENDVETCLHNALDTKYCRFSIDQFYAGNINPGETRLATCLTEALQSKAQDATVLPFISPGGSDARLLRQRGLNVLGFSPVLASDISYDRTIELVHGANERIAIESLIFGRDIFVEAIHNYAGGHDD